MSFAIVMSCSLFMSSLFMYDRLPFRGDINTSRPLSQAIFGLGKGFSLIKHRRVTE